MSSNYYFHKGIFQHPDLISSTQEVTCCSIVLQSVLSEFLPSRERGCSKVVRLMIRRLNMYDDLSVRRLVVPQSGTGTSVLRPPLFSTPSPADLKNLAPSVLAELLENMQTLHSHLFFQPPPTHLPVDISATLPLNFEFTPTGSLYFDISAHLHILELICSDKFQIHYPFVCLFFIVL